MEFVLTGECAPKASVEDALETANEGSADEHDRANFAALLDLWRIPGDGPKFSSPWTPGADNEAATEREAIREMDGSEE